MAKQRVKEAERAAAQARDVRLARASRPGVRIRLGAGFVRLGWWIMGHDSAIPGPPDPRRTYALLILAELIALWRFPPNRRPIRPLLSDFPVDKRKTRERCCRHVGAPVGAPMWHAVRVVPPVTLRTVGQTVSARGGDVCGPGAPEPAERPRRQNGRRIGASFRSTGSQVNR